MWEKLFIIASAIPIAVLGNVMRIVVTAICSEDRPALSVAGRSGRRCWRPFTTWAGYLIEMPAGLLLLWIELTLLSKLLISPLPERPLVHGRVVGRSGQAPVAIRQSPRREQVNVKRQDRATDRRRTAR